MDKEEIKQEGAKRKLQVIGFISWDYIFLYIIWVLSFSITIFMSDQGYRQPSVFIQSMFNIVIELMPNGDSTCLEYKQKHILLSWCHYLDLWALWARNFIFSAFVHLLAVNALSYIFKNKEHLFRSKFWQMICVFLFMLLMSILNEFGQTPSGL
jgi:hypothetical protein